MLSAGKQHLVTGLKLSGTDLRKAELDFYMGRYISVGGISAIMTGLSYIGVTKISIPAVLQPPVIAWQTFMFYTCSCIAMAISLYNLALSAFLVVNAQGLMLRGPPNSVVKCIEILSAQWRLVRVLVTLAVIMTLMSANAIMWMKLDPTTSKPGAAIAVSVIVVVVVLASMERMNRMGRALDIAPGELVRGDVMIESATERINLIVEDEDAIPVNRTAAGESLPPAGWRR